MTALVLPLADHGDIVTALPFFLPALLIAGGLTTLFARERLRRRRDGSNS